MAATSFFPRRDDLLFMAPAGGTQTSWAAVAGRIILNLGKKDDTQLELNA